MLRYAVRRLLQMVPVSFSATLLIYTIVFALPGDLIATPEGQRSLSPGVIDQIKTSYHLDKPFVVQYLLYLKGLFTPDLDQSLQGIEFVLDMLMRAYPITIKPSLMALTFEAIVGIGFGLIAGVRKGGWFGATVLVLSLVVIAAPTFVIGFILQPIVEVRLGRLPVTAGESLGLAKLLAPAVVLGTISSACVPHLTYTEVARNLIASHVRIVRARGLSGIHVTIVHILRNSLVPIITSLGAGPRALIGGAIVTKGISNIKDVGGTLCSAIIHGDSPMVVSSTTVLVLASIVSNLLVDLLYAALDPRIRYA